MTEWIGAAEAAERLGIKPASLYAYVSRGVLARQQEPGGRGSLYDAREIARLARKGRPRRAPAGAELVIETAVTELTPEHLRYRGHDVMELAIERSFEEVALLLWGGDPNAEAGGWQATPAALAVGRAAQAALPSRILPLERLQVIVPALAATDPLRLQLEQPAVIAAGRALIAGMVDCLPPPPAGAAPPAPADTAPPEGPAAADTAPPEGPAAAAERHERAVTAARATATARSCRTPGPEPEAGTRPAEAGGRPAGSIAGRLARALSPAPPPPGLARVVQTALVLLADHELAASTLAARVAASVRADPYAVVATGLGAVGGALHGGASLAAETMLGLAAEPADAPRVVGDLLRRGQRITGFGHFAYPAGDPRSVLLMRVLQEYAPASPRLAVASAVVAEARRRALPEPNVDFALAALASVAGLVPGAGEAIFAVARAAGWIAHALEEYDRHAPIRPRGVYTGPAAPG
ncbi:MAG TPA: citrate/2-methylcitrate synthase [Streptosporangiaceae bacterium]|nr:citrate/2-methylcitrate synthase [Streptosporangiaceae bacterium]